MSNVRIDIASEFTGGRAFKQAEAATTGLEKTVDKLGKKLAGAFSAYKVAQFAKDSVKAFAQDQKAAAVLAKTLENVNQGYATDMVENYIHKTEALYGVLDDKLRPAFAQLVVATGDAAKSQKLLQTALDVSAGTGKDLESVTAALSKAYLGNTTALSRLGAGLSAASLKGKSFDQIISILNQNFSGAAATAADTYQGKLDKLNVAFENMKETIGKGLIDAFTNLNSNTDFNQVITKLQNLATYVSDVIVGTSVLLQGAQTATNGALGKVASDFAAFVVGPGKVFLDFLAKQGSKSTVSKSQPSVVTNFLSDMKKIAATVDAINKKGKDTINNAKILTKEQKDQLALKKASLELDKASGIFNLDKIELAAASMSKQSAEDYARIKLKQDLLALQDAINAGNAEEATRLAKVVEDDYKRVWAFQAQNIALGIQNGTIQNIANAASLIPKDLNLINLDNLKSALDYINQMIAALAKLPTAGGTPTPSQGGSTGGTGSSVFPSLVNPDGSLTPRGKHNLPPTTDSAMETFFGNLNDAVATLNKNTAALQPLVDSGFFDLAYNAAEFSGANINPYQLTDAQAAAYNAGQTTITIVDNTSGLIDVITNTTQQASANGVNTRLVRNTGNLNW
jgi:hypothetical protein